MKKFHEIEEKQPHVNILHIIKKKNEIVVAREVDVGWFSYHYRKYLINGNEKLFIENKRKTFLQFIATPKYDWLNLLNSN